MDAFRPHRLIASRWAQVAFGLVLLIGGLPSGCVSRPAPVSYLTSSTPVMRVLLLVGQTSVPLTIQRPPTVKLASWVSARKVDVPVGSTVSLTMTPTGWQLGGAKLPVGDLVLMPESDGTVAINQARYRGQFRFVRKSDTTFDVINDVDIDGYLKGVLSSELLPQWKQIEAYKAQAVVARTYALYQARMTNRPGYDVFADTRDQVYGGMAVEKPLSDQAVTETAGWVVAAGPTGQEKIFKAYFSSCCGGAGQSAADAFGDPPSPQLSGTAVGALCAAGKFYSWGPVVVTRSDLTDRLKRYGRSNDLPIKDMSGVVRMDVADRNAFGRPVKFVVTDDRGRQYRLTAEDARKAVKLLSGYFRVDNGPDAVRFVDGHGFGHGVGMCQWCTEIRAEQGVAYDQIIRLSYPGRRWFMRTDMSPIPSTPRP